jgi:uncharacterized protein YndB with AHSA1/START domain
MIIIIDIEDEYHVHSTIASIRSLLDLEFERTIQAPAEFIWKGWTDPNMITRWFTPSPWKTIQAEIDLRPGGKFFTMMQSPEGENFPNTGTFLEIIPNKRLVWTNSVLPGFRPAPVDNHPGNFFLTAIIELQDLGGGKTKYYARVMHADQQGKTSHEAMNFKEGWGKALDQLLALQ